MKSHFGPGDAKLGRMTAKQIAGYLKARRDKSKSTFGGISFNDGYNVPTYGITQADYYAIDRSMNDEYGMMASSNLTTAGVKTALRNHPISAKVPPVHHATKKSPAQLQREIDESLAGRPMKDRTHILRDYVITSPAGERTWQAEDAAHAREQHLDAFPDDPDEKILSVRLAREVTKSGKRSHATMQKHHIYRVSKDQRLPSELRGRSVVYLGEKELPAGGGMMTRVALLGVPKAPGRSHSTKMTTSAAKAQQWSVETVAPHDSPGGSGPGPAFQKGDWIEIYSAETKRQAEKDAARWKKEHDNVPTRVVPGPGHKTRRGF